MLILTDTNNRFELHSERTLRGQYDGAVREVAKEARFRFDGNTKTWWTNDPEIALRVVPAVDPKKSAGVIGQAKAELAKKNATIEASQAADAKVELPCPAGLSYLPYQRAGIAYAMGRTNTLIADEMGLGKTIQAIGVINADPEIKRVIVICPASLKVNWKRELEKWLVRPLRVSVVNGTIKPADVLVVNYDVLKKHADALIEFAADLVVCDESHYAKNPKAARTKNTMAIVKSASRRRIFLTGTPILNRPIELWTTLQALDGTTWRSWRYYATRYCGGFEGRYGWDVTGATNLDELQQKLRSSIMVRRLKRDVLTELPAKTRNLIALPGEWFSSALKAEAKVREAIERMAELQQQIDLADAMDDQQLYEALVAQLRDNTSVAFEETALVRHKTALAKVKHVVEHVQNVLEQTDKVILFAWHADVIDQLMAGLADFNPVRVTGQDSINDRQAAVDAFQQDANCRVFVGNIKAAGVGLTLTAACHVVFAELDFVPANISQAEDRAHRYGQTLPVTVDHIVVDGSIDAYMAAMIVGKQRVSDEALNDCSNAIEVNEVDDETLYRSYAAATEDALRDEQRAQWAEEKQRRIVEREQKQLQAAQEREAKRAEEREGRYNNRVESSVRLVTIFSDELRSAVHAGVQYLASVCDGAFSEDARGFAKPDVGIGHYLANLATLTDKQACFALKLCCTYQGQLAVNRPDVYRAVFQEG